MVVAGEKHYTATVFLTCVFDHNKKVLLLYHEKFNKWLPPGGHQEQFENSLEAAVREVLEETGVDISSYVGSGRRLDNRSVALRVPDMIQEVSINANSCDPDHFHLDMVYFVEIPVSVSDELCVQPGESQQIGWFSVKDIDSLDTFDNVAETIRELL
jgi:8-oxo-dGTP pyrophosphatase MutT (NUDIX family)